MAIQPIETIYNGHRFRSRLEARWAVFWGALGVRYAYESQGFNLESLGYYLPDFWIPDWRVWIEIKPAFDHRAAELIVQLEANLGQGALLFEGEPWPGEYVVRGSTDWSRYDEPKRPYLPIEMKLAGCRGCNGFCLVSTGWPTYSDLEIRLGPHACGEGFTGASTESPALRHAFDCARGARFEHGEMPPPPLLDSPVAPRTLACRCADASSRDFCGHRLRITGVVDSIWGRTMAILRDASGEAAIAASPQAWPDLWLSAGERVIVEGRVLSRGQITSRRWCGGLGFVLIVEAMWPA